MSLLLLVDGYNVVAPVAPPRNPDSRWLERERKRLIDRLTKHLDESISRRTCVVFDAANPPPGRDHRYCAGGIDVRFAVGYPEADDLLEELIAAHSAPKQLTVVSSDQRVQSAATRRGSLAIDAQPWLDDLIENRVRLASGAGTGSEPEDPEEKPSVPDDEDTERWMREFGL